MKFVREVALGMRHAHRSIHRDETSSKNITADREASSMQVAILCGGLGTRLQEETVFKPKPMVEIGHKPILWHIMRYYACFGHERFLLCTGYKGDTIKDYFLNYRNRTSDIEVNLSDASVTVLSNADEHLDWKIRIQDTGVSTLTGSRLKRALRYVDDDVFLATYGDGLCNVDLDALVAHHQNSGALATVTAVRPSSRFG
jgi:glucose-1-phosphate cytidylyltransferase